MKKILIALFIPSFLLIVFTMLPTGATADEIVAGYQSTTSLSTSKAAYLLYLSSFDLAGEQSYDDFYAESIGGKIAEFAVWLCNEFGNGGSQSDAANIPNRKTGQFRYDLQNGGDYSSYENLRLNVLEMAEDPDATCTISCCGFATFCWYSFLKDKAPYGTGCTTTVLRNFNEIIKGDGTGEYISVNASPGDLIFYSRQAPSNGRPPVPISGAKTYYHVEVYIGDYTGVDALGENYTLTNTIAGSSLPNRKQDAYIKSIDTSNYVYLVSLSDWLGADAEAISNSEIPENPMDALEGSE